MLSQLVADLGYCLSLSLLFFVSSPVERRYRDSASYQRRGGMVGRRAQWKKRPVPLVLRQTGKPHPLIHIASSTKSVHVCLIVVHVCTHS